MGFHPHKSSARTHSPGKGLGSSGRHSACVNLPSFKSIKDQGANAAMKALTATERSAIYQISFSPNCIWREVVVVEVRTPADEIGAPLAPNRLVFTGNTKFV